MLHLATLKRYSGGAAPWGRAGGCLKALIPGHVPRPVAYNEVLAERVRTELSGREGISERKMFGGISLMLGGKMCVGVIGDDLMVRVGPDSYEEALAAPHTREMDFTGRSLRGFVYVKPSRPSSPNSSFWERMATVCPGKFSFT